MMPADCSASCDVQVMVLLVVQDFTNDVLTGDHDWVNPSDELLASLREELDLDLRDAPDDSDDGIPRAGEGGPTRKCRPWHWLQEMRCAASSNASVWPATHLVQHVSSATLPTTAMSYSCRCCTTHVKT